MDPPTYIIITNLLLIENRAAHSLPCFFSCLFSPDASWLAWAGRFVFLWRETRVNWGVNWSWMCTCRCTCTGPGQLHDPGTLLQPLPVLILTHFLSPRSLFNCRAAHWGHLLDWGPSPWRRWEAFRICCGLTNRERWRSGYGGRVGQQGDTRVYHGTVVWPGEILHLDDSTENVTCWKQEDIMNQTYM